MICDACEAEFSGHYSNGVRLTIVCGSCAASSELVTKTTAICMGASAASLTEVDCLRKRNPYYRSAGDMRLFVREEIKVLAAREGQKKRIIKEEATDRKNAAHAKDAKQQLVKKARTDSLAKRTQSLGGILPTEGMVCGDFLSVRNKKPRVGVRKLLQRKALWNRLAATETPTAVQIFNWAVQNNMTHATPDGALEGLRREKHLFDRVATAEGYRVLSFLGRVDRLTLFGINPVFRESQYDLPVRSVPRELSSLCDKVAKHLDLPFSTVLGKLDGSKKCWITKYMYKIRPERVAMILRPHFLSPTARRELLGRDMRESFCRWGLSESEKTSTAAINIKYSSDIVDVELVSASCYMSNAGVHGGACVVTSRVMATPGATWMETTKAYVEEQLAKKREELARTRMQEHDKYRAGKIVCPCGNVSAKQCPFDRCARCCRGPCRRHRLR